MAWGLGGDTPELDTPNAEVASTDAGNAQRALIGTPVATPPRTAEAEADDDIVELPPPAAGSKPLAEFDTWLEVLIAFFPKCPLRSEDLLISA